MAGTAGAPEEGRRYLPAAGHDWFLPLYDPFVRLFGGDRARRELTAQAALRAGARVLDVGCGTGTFVVELKRLHPDVEVAGIDPDPKALARARRKAERESAAIRFDRGFADRLPYPDASFDRVFSSFMFHHLPAAEKEPALREARRVLAPGGSLHLLDFAGPERAHGLLARLVHSSERLEDNAVPRVLDLLSRAGFADAAVVAERRLVFGRVVYYAAS
jgi:ubiquinone/menaquinone biosynthesis C-methylase UbiE